MPCYLGNEAGSSSFLQRTTKVSVAAFLKRPRPSHRPSAFTAVLARRQFDGSGAAGLIESSAGGQSFPVSRQPSFLHRCIGPASGIGGITFCRAPPYEPGLRGQRGRERGWRDRGQCEHDAPLSRDVRCRGV